MNWLGEIIAQRVRRDDLVLDLGCGIMQATGGRLPSECHVGVDSCAAYLDKIGAPSILASLPDAVNLFRPKSYDVVLLLDVVEHLTKDDAMLLIQGAEAIAIREVILFTPDGYVPQAGFDAWGFGVNEAQEHKCGFTEKELNGMGYRTNKYPNVSAEHGDIRSILGFKSCG